MTFDASEYTKALEGFLVNMGDFQGGKLPYDRMEAAMDPLCSFLRVAKVQIEFYASVHQEIRQIGNQSTTYQKGMPDKNEKKSYREVTEEGSVVVINIFPYEGNAVWTKEEINHVDVMARMLFVFYTRERVSRMAEELAYRDSTIGIYNYKFFMKKLDELLEREVAGRYIACYYNFKRFFHYQPAGGKRYWNPYHATVFYRVTTYAGRQRVRMPYQWRQLYGCV